MEPKRVGGRHNRMHADTATIHAFGVAQARHAAELDAINARFAAVGVQLSPDALGPVGARFVAALSEAVSQQAGLVERLRERAAAAGDTAHHAAEAYVATEHAGKRAIAELGT